MRLKLSILLSALILFGALLQANLSFNLTPATLSGSGTNEVFFTGVLTNSNLTTNFLNNIQITFTNAATNYLTADTNAFFANVPGILLPSEIYNDIAFGIEINPATPPGDYLGTVTIQGGTNIFETNNLSSRSFDILLSPATLGVARSGTNLVLSWPSPPAGSLLQRNANLTTTNWLTITNAQTTTNWQNQLFLVPSLSNQFYRLKYP